MAASPTAVYKSVICFPPVVMEKQLEELRQQLENQCLINEELQRHNKDLGGYKRNSSALTCALKTKAQVQG